VDIDAAKSERAEREAKYEEVISRIKANDRTVTQETLEDGERALRFARFRVAGEESRREEEAERAWLQRLEELREKAIKELDSAKIEKLEAAARKALDAYISACVADNILMGEFAVEFEGLAPLPDGVTVNHGSYGPGVSLDGRDYRPRRLVALVADLAREQLREHVPGFIDLEKPV
jgi:hypothetical protein